MNGNIEDGQDKQVEEDLNGVIYKITNTVNGKVYIGKTKEMYGDKPFGIKGRFKIHKADADTKRGCPKLVNAMRKYGKDKFTIEKLFNCRMDEVDDKEIATIEQYDSTHDDKGYNIALGGKGRSVVHVPESARKNISSRMKLDENTEMNIHPVDRDGKLAGYYAMRREKGKQHRKWFSSTENTVEENLRLAREWLNHFKTTGEELETNKRELPENICEIVEENKAIGYQVYMQINGNRYYRRFSMSNETMEHKLEQAIKYKADVINGTATERENVNMIHKELPKNVFPYKNKNGVVVGYTVKVIVNKIPQTKMFIKTSVPMDEKLKQATEYLASISNK